MARAGWGRRTLVAMAGWALLPLAGALLSPASSLAAVGGAPPAATPPSGGALSPRPGVSPSAWPEPGATERRWWIPLPSQPSISPDADLTPDPRQWRVELIVGRNVEVDCNRHEFSGRIKTETLEARGVTIYRVELGPMRSTRMACPDPSRRRRFVTLSGRPYVVPYDADRPLVVYAPKDAVLRWRIWRPDRSLQPARPF